MESVKPKSVSGRLDSHISPENSKWLAENLKGVDQNVKEILRLVEEKTSAAKEVGVYCSKKPELIAHIVEFHHMHQLLAERYEKLTGEISDCGSRQASLFQTPNKKLSLQKSEQVVGSNLFLSPDGGSPDSSLKEGSEYSLSISSDSDSESFYSTMNRSLVSPMSVDSKQLHRKYAELETELSNVKVKVQGSEHDNIDETMKVRVREHEDNYEMLLKRITECEEELRISNRKLEFSEKENARLNGELKKNDSAVVLMDDLKVELEMEKMKVVELQNKVAELETQIGDSESNVGSLREALKVTGEKIRGLEEELVKLKCEHCNEIAEGTRKFQSQLELAQKEIALLETKLDSEKNQVMELQETTLDYADRISQQDHEIMELDAAFCDVHQTFSQEKKQLQHEISGLLEQQAMLKARIGESEKQIKSLQNEIDECKAEKMEMKSLHDTEAINWQVDFEQFKEEVKGKDELVEGMNKNLDLLKLKYDMLMAEKDGVNAKVDTLNAELCSRDNKIREMENLVCQLQLEHVELAAGSERVGKHTEELRLKVEELQKEVDMQRLVISDRAEEKREAIRQLCFSLEHYRTGYKELRRAFTGHKQHSVLAS